VSDAVTPRVSVVLRTFDHARFIAQAIESVLIQRAPFAFELVIGEDCSSDGTRAIVERYAREQPEIVSAVLPERNLGHGEILRRAMAAARGDFIAYLDGDDYWTSASKLARQVAFLEENPDCASCFHDVSLIYDEAGLPSGSVSPGFGGERFTLEQIVMECFVPAPAMMFRREIAEALPAWIFESAWIDWLIHIRSAQLGAIGYMPQPLAAYRVHRGGMFSGLDRVSQLEGDLDFYRRLEPEMPNQRELIGRCVAFRQAQLAIERLGVPFDACVVLVDPRRELRPYFNGRHARNLPRREGHEVTELQAIREAAPGLPAATRDYGPAGGTLEAAARGCYVVVPRGAAAWVEERPQLRGYLAEQGEIAWQDESVVVHELAPLDTADGGAHARGVRRVEVTMLPPPAELEGGFLDAPTSGALLPAHAVTVVGWVLGHDRRVEKIEFEAGGETIWRAPVQIERPDVAAAFPEQAVEAPGFETTLNVQELPAVSAVGVLAVFADGGRARLAELRLSDRDEAQPPAAR
jgi:glycosyltransferase involved in cell wall biosynthesis